MCFISLISCCDNCQCLLECDLLVQTGNSPGVISKQQLAELAPRWDRNTRAMSNDSAAVEAFGWVREMFAFGLALANGPDNANDVIFRRNLMAQPPFDTTLDDGQPIIHYTYGQTFTAEGNVVAKAEASYHWGKRDHKAKYPRLPIAQPPAGAPATTLRLFADLEATANSPEYRLWWAANSL